MRPPIRSRRPGFTMVELIIVIGMASLALAILFPSLLVARESARRTKCLSNLRQLGLSMVMYCNDNKGYCPASAAKDKQYMEDFIYWQQPNSTWDKTLYTGATTRDLDHGALVKYQGSHFIPGIWTCPSDDLKSHPKFKIGDDTVSYPYSYTMNALLSCELAEQDPVAFDYLEKQAVQIFHLRHAAETVLMLEEGEDTINDGSTSLVGFKGPTLAQVVPGGKDGTDWLAIRHDQRMDRPADKLGIPNTSGRGNAVFCDGHAEWVSREYVQAPLPRHWDPSN